MFSKLITSALFAGFTAGLIGAALQLIFVQPLLLHSELYEGGQLIHPSASAHPDLGGFDLTRDALSVLFTTLIYTAYGFLLVAGMALAGERGINVAPRTGILWGIAGFVAAQLAPAFSLPPELPGSAAADVTARQIWWFATAGTAAIALALLGYGRSTIAWGIAILLLLAPHLIGAPHPDAFTGPVPPELAAAFASRALGVGLATWAILGLCCAWFWQGEAVPAPA